MLFNSLPFLLFFPAVTLIYFLLPFRFRWIWLLAASYYFYMNWEPAYAVLLFGCTAITYICGRLVASAESQAIKKRWLATSLTLNFGILFFYKYYSFVTVNVIALLELVGVRMVVPEFSVLLPVGISFYIFQAVGYTIDVYRNDIPPEKHFGRYALFVAYFPHLVAGPINRSNTLLPEFWKNREFKFQRFYRGLRLMAYGFFMKLVVADRLGIYVDTIYNNADHHSGLSLALATVLFSFQIYCDFAGYSSIAIGASRIMGIYLMTNFKRPYMSRSVVEFWRRWHISLSTWFKDYLYISLGGNRVATKSRLYFNLMITFLVSGLWHGANWTYVIWGGLNGAYLVVENFFRNTHTSIRIPALFRILYTFILINITWIFFRSNSLSQALSVIGKISTSPGKLFVPADPEVLIYCFLALFIVISFETFYEFVYHRRKIRKHHTAISYAFMMFLLLCIVMFGVFDGGQFIYFQF